MQADHTTLQDAMAQLARTEGYLQSDPGNTDLLARAIDQGLAAGALEQALGHVREAMARYPGDPFFSYRHAHVLFALKQWSEAAAIYAALLEQHADVNIASSLAQCQVQLGSHQQALAVLAPWLADEALAATLDAAGATAVVRALHHTGAPEQATAFAAVHQQRLAGHAAFLGAASLAWLDQGELAQAGEWSAAALALDPEAAEALVARATIALSKADSAAAIAGFQQVLARHPGEGRSWSGLGMASLLEREIGAAAGQLEQALVYMPGHIGTWHALGWCKLFSKDLDGAEAAFASAMALDRNFGESHGAVAVVAALKGQRAVAEAAIERALRLDRGGLAARYAQAVLSGEAGDPERFGAFAQNALAGRMGPGGEDMAAMVARLARR